jgi:hypothetical protein
MNSTADSSAWRIGGVSSIAWSLPAARMLVSCLVFTGFAPPPKAWIVDRVAKLQTLLAQRTEASALALRRLTGPVTLSPEKPEVGRAYFRVRCNVDSLNLLVAEDGSNLLHLRRGRDSNPR